MSSQRKNKMLIIMVLVLLVTNIAMLYYLVGYYREEKKSKTEKQVEYVTRELQLDDIQVKQYITLRAKRDSIMVPMNEKLAIAKMKMISFLSQPVNTVSDSLISKTADEITTAQKQLEVAFYQHFRRVQAMCKPEQLPRYDTMLVKMVERTTGKRDRK